MENLKRIESLYERMYDIIARHSSTASNKSWMTGVSGRDESFLSCPSVDKLIKASIMLPVAWRLTYGLAIDSIRKFDLFSEESEIDNKNLWIELEKLNFLKEWRKLNGYARATGKALLVLQEEGVDYKDLKEPLGFGRIIGMKAYSEQNYGESVKDIYGKFEYYEVFTQDIPHLSIHPSRCIEFDPYLNSEGELIPIWSDLMLAMILTEAGGHYAFRHAVGHLIFKEKEGASVEITKDFTDKVSTKPTTMGSYFILPAEIEEVMSLTPNILDLPPLLDMAYTNIAAKTSIPKSILKGEVLGLRGSETNERQYYALIENTESENEHDIKELLAILQTNNGLTLPDHYEIKWDVHFVETLEVRLDNDIKRTQILNSMFQFATDQEIRKKANEFFPDVISLDVPFNRSVIKLNPEKGEIQISGGNTPNKQESINWAEIDHSINNIEGVSRWCKEHAISTQTFYKIKNALKKEVK